jgi:serine O-acetyltransferase
MKYIRNRNANSFGQSLAQIQENLVSQVAFFGKLTRLEKSLIYRYILEAITKTNETQSLVTSTHQTFDHLNTHYSTSMLYWLGNTIYSNEKNEALSICEKLYLLNRTINAVDLYYKIEMPNHFLVSHGLGTVFSKSRYSDFLVVFHNVTIGVKDTVYPVLGERVVVYPNTTIVGACTIGSDTVLGTGLTLVDTDIPNNSIVYSKHGDILIKPNNGSEIGKYFDL